MANVLPREKQILVLKLLAEGNSIRSTERVRKRTITNLLVRFHVAHFNFCWRPRRNIGGGYRLTPAMQAGGRQSTHQAARKFGRPNF